MVLYSTGALVVSFSVKKRTFSIQSTKETKKIPEISREICLGCLILNMCDPAEAHVNHSLIHH